MNGRWDLGKRKVEGQTPRELVKDLPASGKACELVLYWEKLCTKRGGAVCSRTDQWNLVTS